MLVEILINTRDNSDMNPKREDAIMKRIISAAVLTLILAGAAFGLSDKEYIRMKKSSRAFREADEFMTECYEECKDTLPYSQFREVQKEQREWIKSGRDEEAQIFIEDGMTRIEAYTKVTDMRADTLHHYCVIYRNANYEGYMNAK